MTGFIRRRPVSSLLLIVLIALLGWIWHEREA
ncbi:MAG: amidase, partial [Pseudomonas laurylsulfatiphila]